MISRTNQTIATRADRIAERVAHFSKFGHVTRERAEIMAERLIDSLDAEAKERARNAHLAAEQARIHVADQAAKTEAMVEGESGVYEDEACTVSVEDEATLPSIFFHLSGQDLTRFWYTAPHSYDRHKLLVSNKGEAFWYGLGGVRLDDDMTVEEFLTYEG